MLPTNLQYYSLVSCRSSRATKNKKKGEAGESKSEGEGDVVKCHKPQVERYGKETNFWAQVGFVKRLTLVHSLWVLWHVFLVSSHKESELFRWPSCAMFWRSAVLCCVYVLRMDFPKLLLKRIFHVLLKLYKGNSIQVFSTISNRPTTFERKPLHIRNAVNKLLSVPRRHSDSSPITVRWDCVIRQDGGCGWHCWDNNGASLDWTGLLSVIVLRRRLKRSSSWITAQEMKLLLI